MSERVRVEIEGRVQGVGFRYSTYNEAMALGLNGWVRNTPDGRVEAEFEGEPETLERMLAWCRHGPPGAVVRGVHSNFASGNPIYTGFHIRY